MDVDDVGVQGQVEDLVASYKLLEDDAARGLGAVKDRLNQSILEQWIDLAKSGKLSEDHIGLIRSSWTLSFGARKRATKTTDRLSPSLDTLGTSTPRKKKRKTNGSVNGDGNDDDGDDNDDVDEDPKLAAAMAAVAQARQAKTLAAVRRKVTLATAKDRLMQHKVSWRRHLHNEDGIKYDSRYLLEKLPSIMS